MVEILLKDLITYIIPFLIFSMLISLVSYPFARLFFIKNADKGFANSTIIGVVFLSWIYFCVSLISSLNNISIFKLSSIYSLILSCVVWILINLLILYKFKGSILLSIKLTYDLKKFYKTFLIMSLLLIIFYFVNSFNSITEPGMSENLMNLGILNSLFNSTELPLKDMWFSGKNFNYYYFGHFIFFTISKILNIIPNEGFYFIATITPTLFLTSFFVFLKTIYLGRYPNDKPFKGALAGIFGVLFLTLSNPAKSLLAIYEYILGLKSLNQIYNEYHVYTVRIIQNTIAENYNYSFLINPLHAHTTNLIVGIIVLNLFYNFLDENKTISVKNKYLVLSFFLIGVMYTINSWDLLIYLPLFVFLVTLSQFKNLKKNFLPNIKQLILLAYPLILGLIPFAIFLVAPVGIPNIVRTPSKIEEFLGFWGLYLVLTFILFFYDKKKINNNKFLEGISLFSLIALLLLEIFFLPDPTYSSDYYRANTYYKVSNIIILLFTISISVTLSKYISEPKRYLQKICILTVIILIFCSSVLIIKLKLKSNPSFTGMVNQEGYIRNFSEELFELYLYLQNHKTPNTIILESSSSKAYENASLISVYSGVQNVLGWQNHELTWRNSKSLINEVYTRIEDTNDIFTSDDFVKTQELVKKYNVNYIVIGKSEKEMYKDKLKVDKLVRLGVTVFEKGDTKLIKVTP